MMLFEGTCHVSVPSFASCKSVLDLLFIEVDSEMFCKKKRIKFVFFSLDLGLSELLKFLLLVNCVGCVSSVLEILVILSWLVER